MYLIFHKIKLTKKDEKGKIILGDIMRNSKDKNNRKSMITLKSLITFLTIIIILLYMVIFYNYYFVRNKVFARETSSKPEEDIIISEAEKVNIDNILEENKKQNKEEYTTEEVELEYITKYKNNASLPKGTIQVVQEGRQGKQQITKKVVYENDELVSEEQVTCKVTKAAVNKIVEIGTGGYVSNYKVKVGDKLYVTSDRLSVMVEPNENSQKVATLSKGNELKVLEMSGDWYKISSSGTIGYVKSECTTYIDSSVKKEEQTNGGGNKNKAQLLSNLSFNMTLNKPSGLSLEQFKKVLSDDKDKNKIFENNAEYFYYIEKQYNINGIFVAAVGIHESAWGTSKIARDKNNLFGYGAYDSNPYNGAYSFSNYSESIDLISRVFVKYYLNPKGTNIYGGEKALGTYYNGSTLSGVNTKYATDKNWANGVYTHMKYLYNKL